MLALGSVWIALISLLIACAMVLYRPAFTDLTVLLVTYFGTPGALCFAILILWSYRKDLDPEPGVVAQRFQAKIAIAMALASAAIVYLLVIFAVPIPRIER